MQRTGKWWTSEEKQTLKIMYPKEPREKLIATFQRSWKSISGKAQVMGIKRELSLLKSPHLSLTESEKAYLAGIIDGEGSIYMGVNRHPRATLGFCYEIHLEITNTDKKLIEWLMNKLGGRNVSWRPKRCDRSLCYYWAMAKLEDVYTVLKEVYPYLILKRERAEVAMNYIQKRLQLMATPLQRDVSKFDVHVYEKLKYLNRKMRNQNV